MNKGKHEPCPRCRENGRDSRGDNLFRYDDGHGHCFACHYHDWKRIPTLGYNPGIRPVKEQETIYTTNNPHDLPLPKDATHTIDAKALDWLSKYEITSEEVRENHLLWSPQKQYLIFPVYLQRELYDSSLHIKYGYENRLLCWQARVFNPEWKSRYYNVGPFHDVFHVMNLVNGVGDAIVVVEDFVSAMKVSRRYSALPLFGANLSIFQMKRMKSAYLAERLIFWLDEDKAEKGMNLAKRASTLGINASFICTKHDPKEYTDNEIQDFIET